MTYQDTIIEMTTSALDSLTRTIDAMPAERLEWSPLDQGRTALNQLAECVQVAGWFERVMREKGASFFTTEFILEERKVRDAMTKAQLDSMIGPVHESLFTAMRALTDADLEAKITFRPGWEPTLREVCYFPLRNLWYHFGQVNYIQTLYGDREMH